MSQRKRRLVVGWWARLAPMLACGAVGAALGLHFSDVSYRATASVLVEGSNACPVPIHEHRPQLVTFIGPQCAEATIVSPHVRRTRANNVVTYSVSSTTPERAIRLANRYAYRYIRDMNRHNVARFDDAIAALTRKLREGRTEGHNVLAKALRQQLNELRTFRKSVAASLTMVIRPADAATRTRVHAARNSSIGLFAGILVALAITFARAAWTRRRRTT
jgi:uncharacterized protein involved in exopolysaccharide biosynthesis